jgi:hypothetical protein
VWLRKWRRLLEGAESVREPEAAGEDWAGAGKFVYSAVGISAIETVYL